MLNKIYTYPSKIKSHFAESIVSRNILSLGWIQVANVLLPLITVPYLSRVLGVEQIGIYALSQSICTFGLVLVDYGFNLSATRQVAQSLNFSEEITNIFWGVQFAKIILLLPTILIIMILVMLVPSFFVIWPVILCSSLMLLGTIFFPQWLFQGLEKMHVITYITIGARILTIPLVFLFVKSSHDTWLAALIQSLGIVFSGVMATYYVLKNKVILWKRPRWDAIKTAYEEGWHVFISGLAISFYTSLNSVLISFFASVQSVGIFSAADKIKSSALSLITPISTAVYPRVNALFVDDKNKGLDFARRMFLIQGGLTFLIFCTLFIFASPIVRILMGDGFLGAIMVLKILSPSIFFMGLSNVLGLHIMLPMNLNKIFSRIVMSGGVFNVFFISIFSFQWGANGAALAVTLTEGLIAMLMFLVLRRSGITLIERK